MMNLIKQSDPYSRLEEFGKDFQETLENEIGVARLPFHVNRVGSMISVFARETEPKNDSDATKIDEKLFNRYFWAMIEEGFMIPPSPFEAYFLSIPLSEIPADEWKVKIRNVFQGLRNV